MSKHTPGPWTAGTSLIDGKEMFTACESRDTRRVMAITGTCGLQDEIESIANTILIAASPDLLEAAKEALEYLESWKDLGGSRAYRMLDSAISKATGAPQ